MAHRDATTLGLTISVVRNGRDVTVTVLGEVDLATVGGLEEELASLANGNGARYDCVTVDVGGVNFLSASGLASLVEAEQALGQRGSSLRLRAPQRSVVKLLELTNLSHLLVD